MKKNNLYGISWLKLILYCITIIGIIFIYLEWLNNKRAKRELTKALLQIRSLLKRYRQVTDFNRYFAYREQVLLKKDMDPVQKLIPDNYLNIGIELDALKDIMEFSGISKNLSSFRKAYNDKFVPREIEEYRSFFAVLESYPLSEDQMAAIVRDEDNNLVIAGAGTGKTTTISAKVAYILKKGLAIPQELLIISFTNNAVNEMYERTSAFCSEIPGSEDIEVRTFNGFGNMVNRTCNPKPLKTAFEGDDQLAKAFLQEAFDRLFITDESFQSRAINFITFFNRPVKDEFAFSTMNDFIRHQKSYQNTSLNNIRVKSWEELQIANFLYLHKVDFEYESFFPLEKEDQNHNFQHYSPDFYLPKYQIYHEHYGINENGDVPDWFKTRPPFATAREYYHSGMQWKEMIHEKYGTKLIKTYSFQSRNNTLLGSLKKQLDQLGVAMEKRSSEETLPLIKKSGHYEEFMNLVYTFLGLMKSNNTTTVPLMEVKGDKRLEIFLAIFVPLYQSYQNELARTATIDYNDMVNNATAYIQQGSFPKKYKYILVDEFQDMSLGRYALIKSLKSNNPGAKLYAVGDDWQSIFRFTGSDISIITTFASHFGETAQTPVLQTYRFNDQILSLSSGFIQKNPSQLQKELSTNLKANMPSFECVPINFNGLAKASHELLKWDTFDLILHTISLSHPTGKIFIIGRYNRNRPPDLAELQKKYKAMSIHYFTAHSAKGLTCDYAILTDLDSGVYGFPSEIADDPLLGYLLHEGENFENAEERRLFYVALTRARHKVYLLYNSLSPSKFIDELISEGLLTDGRLQELKCPNCAGILTERSSKGHAFIGCSNYPQCTYTANLPTNQPDQQENKKNPPLAKTL